MAKGKKSGGSSRKGRRFGWVGPFAAGFLAISLLGAAVLVWQGYVKLPPLTLPAIEFGKSAAPPPAPSPTTLKSQPAAAPAARAAVPTTAPIPQATSTRVPSTPTAVPAARTPATLPTVMPSPTPGSKIVLKVPIYRQEHALSCEAAALRMALATFGLQVPEEKLLASLAKDPTPRKVVDGIVQWGDPDVGFVGNWDGVYLQDGYGVYEKPIADLAMTLGYEGVRFGKEVNPKQLYAALRDGLPSVVWMPYDLTVKGRGSWVTPAGKKVPYLVTEHAVVLAGLDTEGVYYADPMKPALQHVSYAAFEKALDELDGRYVTVKP